ncbi:MAG: DUF1592 domain-containing protein [Planctomycetales bacterium]|nr:DUF1592 domain-containing protein [Planctomycetales bacterium]
MKRIIRQVCGLVLLLGCCATRDGIAADQTAFDAIGAEYTRDVRPLLTQFCLRCHSMEKQEGELDLERFAKLDDVRRGTAAWLKVAEMLDNGEMPPKKSKQPSAEQRKQLRGWVERYLHAEALANAGDPGPVVLRRLSNAEYTYTIRDLTGVSLDPAKEFPADSAAGEGFTNTGNALVMSPALLTKYLDAGKEIARHAVLLPDGFRFSPTMTPSDWTNDDLARIREFYREFTDVGGGTQVNLQGIVFDTNNGGRLPVERYLAATLIVAESLRDSAAAARSAAATAKTIATVATERGLNAKYLGILWTTLNDREPSLLLDGVRTRWRTAKAEDAVPLAVEISQWQKALWRFTSVGHIGKVGGPKAWQEPVTPLAARQEVRLKLPTTPDQKEISLYLVTSDAGDGNEHDFVVWQQPRLVAPGRPDLLLRDVRDFSREMTTRRDRTFAATAKALNAAAELAQAEGKGDVAAIAKKHEVDAESLTAWLDFLGIGSSATLKLDHFKEKLMSAASYDFVKGWGSHQTPLLLASSSDQHVRIPGNMKPHGVTVHPSPTLSAAVGWRSPIAGVLRIEGQVKHAHPECGNGVTWSLELRRGATRQRLATGVVQGNTAVKIAPIEALAVQPGDLVSLLIGPRDGNHSCDLTDLELVLKSSGENSREWSLTGDVSNDVLAGNPHADRFGNDGVWHFYTEPVKGNEAGPVIPAGSLLAQWQAASKTEEKQELATAIQKLLTNGPAAGADEKQPDVVLYRQLSSLGGPLLARSVTLGTGRDGGSRASTHPTDIGLDPALFGKHPNGSAIDAASLCVRAPSVIEVRLPAGLVAGAEFVTTGMLHPQTGAEGSVQLQVLTTKPERAAGLQPTSVTETNANGPWTSNNRGVSHATPILVNDGSAARQRIESSFEKFRSVFPLALCYTKIVPVDEVVTLTLFHREDDHLQRLMLDDAQTARLNRLWDELHFVSHDALTLVDAFLQLLEYASQDADPKVFEPMRKPINDRAAAFRKTLVDAEPKHIESLIDFAARAYRRSLTASESSELRGLYRRLREQELPHDEAFRFTLARVFIAPAFLYRLEQAPAGAAAAAVSDAELASRLSYFLWSSQPDDELHAVAASGRLHEPDVLKAQAKRMLTNARTRRLATEFACQWLHIYDFDALDEKSEKHFPEFAELRGDMYEESILFFTDLFQRDASVLSLLDADHTFVNERLAKFYGVPFDKDRHRARPGGSTASALLTSQDVRTSAEAVKPLGQTQGRDEIGWQRIDGLRQQGRGGILGLSTTLAKQSGASRTSPILRGNWISEVLLGEKLPKPPKDVPRLPEDETATEGLTVRQLIEKHTSDVRCSSCHQKIDPFGFALEGFDAIGRRRDKDLAARPIDTHTKLPDGTEINGLNGLRDYLLKTRRDAILQQFCRKLLGYALGRGTQLSDEPLLTEMQQQLARNGYRFSVAVETIVSSQQFRMIRGATSLAEEGN